MPTQTYIRAASAPSAARTESGEVSLAHYGVFLVDELPQFDRSVLDALRQPLEDGVVTVSRAAGTLTFPASCILVGAMNPCPCGFKGLPEEKCVGLSICERYGAKISGPLRDRIDIHIEVPRLKPEELLGMQPGECSEAIRERVVRARSLQHQRLGGHRISAKTTPREIRDVIAGHGKPSLHAPGLRANAHFRAGVRSDIEGWPDNCGSCWFADGWAISLGGGRPIPRSGERILAGNAR